MSETRLAELMAEYGISNIALARKSGVSLRTVQNIKKGVTTASPLVDKAMSRALRSLIAKAKEGA